MTNTNCTASLLTFVACALLAEQNIDTPHFVDMLILSALTFALFVGELVHAKRR
ncbi:MAG: hypothetical protein KDJ39_06080 [Gammaproteobacteria bacterium]|nr:hypothetical protein [Gammaproteobacteria bacterium]